MKKFFIGLLVLSVMASMSFASIGVGVKNIVANNTVELSITGNPVNFTIGGTYATSDNYILTGSVVERVTGLGVDAAYNSIAQATVANLILEKELSIGKSLSILFDVDLLSYNSGTTSMAALTGGSLGVRTYIM